MNKLAAPPLPLADIHLHAVPSYWPLAWGWWAVIIVSLIMIAFAGYQLRRRSRHLAAKQEAITVLKDCQPDGGLTVINTVLKQAALSYFPRTLVAPLTGAQWLLFLDQQLPPKYQGFVGLQSLWLQGLFSSIPLTEQQFNNCQQQALQWLQHAIPTNNNDRSITTTMIAKESSNV